MSKTPATIGRYQVLNRIGQGGMGSLYLAWDPMLERQIAIKLLRDDNDELRERFAREARSVARLRHPHIVMIFDVGEQDGQPFIAMEYIHGQTLADIIRSEAQLPVTRKLQLVDELCDGLGFAHKTAIVHRDVKPANVMVEHEGVVKILDFGIARIAESGMTQAGMLIGTLNYMSPEQVAGQVVDSRSDIFAVGAVMYELLSQRQAFPGGLQNGILNRIMHEQPPALATVCPSLGAEVIEIVERALEKEPQARYQDLGAMRKDLQRARQRLELNPPETIALAVQPADETVTLETPREVAGRPSTPKRGTHREGLARLRVTQIAAHLETANRALATHDFEGAIAAAEQALLLDPEESGAVEIMDRARAALDERHVQELVKRGEELLRVGSMTEAMGLADQALTIAPGSTAAIELRGAVDRLRAERERERERVEAVRATTERAQELLDRGAFEEAAAAAIEALARSPDHEAAQVIQRRAQEAIELARQEALDRLAAKTIGEARRVFEDGRQDEAVAMLAGFETEHARVAEALEDLRQQKARIERQREAHRARQEQVAAVIARANQTASHEAAVAILNDAAALDPERADLRELLLERQAALDREREEARRIRERDEKIAAGVAKAKGTPSHESAIAILDEVLALDPGRSDLRQMLDARKVALEREREEARRLRERQEKVAAALRQAEATPAHEAAITLLKDALALDPARADVRQMLDRRQTGLQHERDEARRSKERQQNIAAAIKEAKATSSHDAALAILKKALALEPAHAQLRELIGTRQAALDREREQARLERERQDRIAATIAKANGTKAHEPAIAILTEALALEPAHAEMARLLQVRRGALEEEKRLERERRERIAGAIAKAKGTAAHAEAIAILKEVLTLDPQHAEIRQLLNARQADLTRERDEARRERERQEQIAAAIAQARNAASPEAAVAILQGASSLDPAHAEIRQLLASAQAALEREREEARLLRERQERVAAAFKKAKGAKSHVAAIELLTEVLALDPAHREARSLLDSHEATLERERVEAKRRQDIESSRQSIAQLIARKEFDAAESALQHAEQALQAKKLLKDQRRLLRDARAAASVADGSRPPFTLGRGAIAGLAAAAVVVLVAGYLMTRSSSTSESSVPEPTLADAPAAPGAPASSAQPPPQSVSPPQPSLPTTASSPPLAVPPATLAPGDVRTTPDATGDVAAAQAPKVAAALQLGRQQIARSELQPAMATIAGALRLDPTNRELRALATDVLARARQATSTARTAASERGEAATGTSAYRDAQARETEAGRQERAGRPEQAVRLLSEAAGLFGEAQREAQVAASRATPPPQEPVARPTVPAPSPPPPTRTEPPAVTPPATTTPAPPPARVPTPAPAPPQPSPSATDESAIRTTLREYAAAYESLDVAAVRRVYPTVNAAALDRSFRDMSAQEVQIGDEQITIDGTTAVVRAQVRQSFTPKVGRGRSQVIKSEFRLQKAGGRWVIVERR